MKGGMSKTLKIGGRTYHLDRSYRKKSDANKRAKNIREDGATARIMKIGDMNRVFRGPRDKR